MPSNNEEPLFHSTPDHHPHHHHAQQKAPPTETEGRVVLVTGATGHIGRALCERLVLNKKGFPSSHSNNDHHDDIPYSLIYALGRNEKIGSELETQALLSSSSSSSSSQPPPPRLKFIPCDLVQQPEILQDLILNSGIDVIYHCAALSTAWANPKDIYNTNVVGTRNLLEACIKLYSDEKKKKLKRFIYLGTPSIYMSKHHRMNISEDDDEKNVKFENILNDYAKSKYIAEKEVLNAFRQFGIPVVVIRPRAVIGIHDTAILPRITEILQQRRFVNLCEKNEKIFVDLTFIDNVIEALILAERSDKCVGKVYNITNGEPLDLLELCKFVAEKYLNIDMNFDKKTSPNTFLPKKLNFKFVYFLGYLFEFVYGFFGWYEKDPPLTRYTVTTIGRTNTFDITNAKRDLNYHPKVGITDGIRAVMEYHHRSSKL
ncbi:hypothetical protein FDP41_000144 [Naegleria fowleri]|uniref:NAD-dependent epimerase/dehydratase domain-containing protein n=1 Tax=Naegleria fowleri TaxID=5763 RepID=A0A6A5CIG4_NAEFO|nr:uncharacterized protein FDP41_000144 [Naegleria fowleri]KAF0985105.1 hypothetical protein FDP41_000144 [Naegleria fowleri]CAG4711330.1 unnamed protein product [Naegleria fowleri]